MFPPDPKARADHRAGTLYAVAGEGVWVYYAQATPARCFALLRRRDRACAPPEVALGSEVMSQVFIDRASIGRALRVGAWKKLGRFAPHAATLEQPDIVQWPFGTLTVTVWTDGQPRTGTRIEDPAIQHLEIMASWDAVHHVPARLAADFGVEPALWWVGGPVWRQRRVREAYARLNPAYHRLPPDWVWTEAG